MTKRERDLVEAVYALLEHISDKYGDVCSVEDWKCEYHRKLAELINFDYPDNTPTGNGDSND